MLIVLCVMLTWVCCFSCVCCFCFGFLGLLALVSIGAGAGWRLVFVG